MDLALVITLLIVLLGVLIGLVFVIHDLRLNRVLLDRLAQQLGAQRLQQGGQGEFQQQRYRYLVLPKGSESGDVFRLILNANIPFEIQIETPYFLAKQAQQWGIKTPLCSGDAQFDQQFEACCQPPAPEQHCLQQANTQQAIRRLFAAGVTRLEYASEQQAIVADLYPFRQHDSWSGQQVKNLLMMMLPLLSDLPQHAQARQKPSTSIQLQYFLPAYLFLLLALSFGFLGGIAADLAYQPVDRQPLVWLALLLSLVLLVLLGYYTRKKLQSTIDGWKHGLGLMVLALLSLPPFSYSVLCGLNGGLDHQAAQTVELTILSKQKIKRGGQLEYQIQTEGRVPGETKSWEVEQDLFKQAKPKKQRQQPIYNEYPGWLGIAWRNSREDLRVQ